MGQVKCHYASDFSDQTVATIVIIFNEDSWMLIMHQYKCWYTLQGPSTDLGHTDAYMYIHG